MRGSINNAQVGHKPVIAIGAARSGIVLGVDLVARDGPRYASRVSRDWDDRAGGHKLGGTAVTQPVHIVIGVAALGDVAIEEDRLAGLKVRVAIALQADRDRAASGRQLKAGGVNAVYRQTGGLEVLVGEAIETGGANGHFVGRRGGKRGLGQGRALEARRLPVACLIIVQH